MNHRPLRICLPWIFSLLGATVTLGENTSPPPAPAAAAATATNEIPKSVFTNFALQPQRVLFAGQLARLVQQRRLAELEALLLQMAKTDPVPRAVAEHDYNLACVQVALGKPDEAIASLQRAVDGGYSDQAHMLEDTDLASLRSKPVFDELVAKAKKTAEAATTLTFRQGGGTIQIDPAASLRAEPFAAGAVTNGTAMVAEANTLWSPQLGGVGLVVHRFDPASPQKDAPITKNQDAVGELLRTWQKEGSAAGLWGVIYDNHDRGHSNLSTADFPQLTRLAFCEAAKKFGLDNGLQYHFLHTAERSPGWPRGCIVLGNTSEAVVNGDYWRSLPRAALTTARAIEVVTAHYFANHLSFYPSHADHNAGQNGDVFPANTPYFIISQGSSGTDQPFLRAVASTIAAFRPETRLALEDKGLIAPAVQMILRLCNKNVAKPEDYLTGRAHPTVFDAQQLDVEKMVRTAHDMKADEIPGVAFLQIQEGSAARPGVDYISPFPEPMLGTPCAIAYVARALDYERRVVVNAATDSDPHLRKLRFHWVVLRGNADMIRIKTLNDAGSRAEIIIPDHTRRPILPGAALESSRVDIGVFTHNGIHYSAPSFLSVYYLDNETRVYDGKRIRSVEYKSPARGGRYVDPALEVAKDWKDEYRYDEQDRLLGWTRTMPDGKQSEFTRNGELVLTKDGKGRVTEAVAPTYNVTQPGPGQAPRLEWKPGSGKVVYEYASEDDRLGKSRAQPE